MASSANSDNENEPFSASDSMTLDLPTQLVDNDSEEDENRNKDGAEEDKQLEEILTFSEPSFEQFNNTHFNDEEEIDDEVENSLLGKYIQL